LPCSWALSDKELAELALFRNAGSRSNILFFDGTPGQFDAHGKLRPETPQIFRGAESSISAVTAQWQTRGSTQPKLDPADYPAERLKGSAYRNLSAWANGQLRCPYPAVSIPAEVHTHIHRFRARHGELLAIERNVDYHMSEELKQA